MSGAIQHNFNKILWGKWLLDMKASWFFSFSNYILQSVQHVYLSKRPLQIKRGKNYNSKPPHTSEHRPWKLKAPSSNPTANATFWHKLLAQAELPCKSNQNAFGPWFLSGQEQAARSSLIPSYTGHSTSGACMKAREQYYVYMYDQEYATRQWVLPQQNRKCVSSNIHTCGLVYILCHLTLHPVQQMGSCILSVM